MAAPAPRAALPAAALTVLVLYASLFPFEGWRWPGDRALADLLLPPWPRHSPSFDLWSNFLGYLPLGLLLALAWGRPLAAALAGVALSWALEFAQQFLPARHPSMVDWLLNGAGAVAGALLAAPVRAWRWPRAWWHRATHWLDAGAAGAVALLLLWPVALLFPAPVPLGLGQIGPRLMPLLAEALEGVPWAADWHAALQPEALAPPPLGLPLETAVTALGLLAPCLVAYAVVPAGVRRALLALGAAALGVGVLMLSTALNFGPEHALTWLSPVTAEALALGTLLALGLAPVPRRVAAGLGLVALTALVLLVARAPVDPYFALSLQRWEQGRFIRFHGLAQWIGWLWPYAAALWLLGRLGGAPKIDR